MLSHIAFYFSFFFFFRTIPLLSFSALTRQRSPLQLCKTPPPSPASQPSYSSLYLSLPFPLSLTSLLPLCSVDLSRRPFTKLIHHSHITTMPVSVNDPFLLASFSSTTHHHQQQQAVSCSPEERDTTPANYEEDSGLLVVAVQGEGVQLYNVSRQVLLPCG